MNDTLDLLDWKRRIFELYAQIRRAADPAEAWLLWRAGRDDLFRSHRQSPLPESRRSSFSGIGYFPYDPDMRFLAEVVTVEARSLEIGVSGGSPIRFTRLGLARFELGELELYWLDGYGGGLFLPFGDETNGRKTYAAGRYLLDTVKGADLGTVDGRLVLDFNFAYNPSCSYDDRWACPLAPAANRLGVEVRAGESTTGAGGSAAAGEPPAER